MRKIILILLVLLIAALVVKFAIWTPVEPKSGPRKPTKWELLDRKFTERNLRAIAHAITSYGNDPLGVPPPSLERLVAVGGLRAGDLISPMSGRSREDAITYRDGYPLLPSDYVYIALPNTAPEGLVWVYEKPENYKDSPWGEGTLVLLNGDIWTPKWMNLKELQEALSRTHKWLADHDFTPGWTNLAESKKNLRIIGDAISEYRPLEYKFPPSLEELIRERQKEAYHMNLVLWLVSPVSGRNRLRTDKNGIPIEPIDYEYIPLPYSAPATLIQVYERPENYKGSRWGEGTLVLLKDENRESGKVEWMDIKSFQAALDRTHKWISEHDKKSSQPAPTVESE